MAPQYCYIYIPRAPRSCLGYDGPELHARLGFRLLHRAGGTSSILFEPVRVIIVFVLERGVGVAQHEQLP